MANPDTCRHNVISQSTGTHGAFGQFLWGNDGRTPEQKPSTPLDTDEFFEFLRENGVHVEDWQRERIREYLAARDRGVEWAQA